MVSYSFRFSFQYNCNKCIIILLIYFNHFALEWKMDPSKNNVIAHILDDNTVVDQTGFKTTVDNFCNKVC